MALPNHIKQKLTKRTHDNSLRTLSINEDLIDFYSNDYLGFARSNDLHQKTYELVKPLSIKNGSTGSRLISGNSTLVEKTEKIIADYHGAEKALLFGSGYQANLGLISAIPQLGETILYDELAHASIRDGIRLSNAKAYKFKHNDLAKLEQLLKKYSGTKYVIIEGVYSMDGDQPDKKSIVKLCEKYKAFLIVDEAHSLGVVGKNGKGVFSDIESDFLLARVFTYGKSLGCHGAVACGNKKLIKYLINYSRSFIYTTALSPHSIANIKVAYKKLSSTSRVSKLNDNIVFFNHLIKQHNLSHKFIKSTSAIQSLITEDNELSVSIVNHLNKKGFIVKAIQSPTVPKGKERIRISLHSFNKKSQIESLILHLLEIIRQ